MPPTDVAKTITRHREGLRWSKRRLAREAHLSPAYIVQLEKGDRPITGRALGDIAEAVGVPPYRLLAEAGLIPAEHVEEAERIATIALDDPAISVQALATDVGGKLAWLVSDYLNMLGDDAYGRDTGGPYLVAIDWSALAPERWQALRDGKTNATTKADVRQGLLRAADELDRREAEYSKPPTAVEGWDELTETQRRLVQQLVNQFRRSADSE